MRKRQEVFRAARDENVSWFCACHRFAAIIGGQVGMKSGKAANLSARFMAGQGIRQGTTRRLWRR